MDAILAHRELHHPTMMNLPNTSLNIRLEIDLSTDKKNKFVEKYQKILELPHPYDHGEDRTILAFCQSTEMMEEARNAGAMLVGGKDVIKSIEVCNLIRFRLKYAFVKYNFVIFINNLYILCN